jgi:alkylhydroperoxidase family enzyme
VTGAEPSRPLLKPLPAEEWDDGARQALSPLLPASRANPRDAGNILATLVRHQPLAHAYLTFNAYLLLNSTLSARVREVAVLRAALASRSDYLWDHHVPLAERACITSAEIDAIRRGDPTDPVDALVVRAVDELDEHRAITGETWVALGEHLSDAQRLDLLFTVGGYQLLALVVNTLGIEPEDHRGREEQSSH